MMISGATMENIWIIDDFQGSENVRAILEFLIPEYASLFGYETMNSEKCRIFNNPNSDCPMLIHSDPIRIRLSQENLFYWAQTIYQLSHELCHYAFRYHKKDKNLILSWFEEVVCEAMSLYALKYAATNWEKCTLSKWNPNFGKSIENYLAKELIRTATYDFRECKSLLLLERYEKLRYAEKYRESQIMERNYVYGLISSSPSDTHVLLQYTHYINPTNSVTIDFSRWLADFPCDLLRQLEIIQPVKYF